MSKKPSPKAGAVTDASIKTEGAGGADIPPRVDMTSDLSGAILPDTTATPGAADAASSPGRKPRQARASVRKRKYKAREKPPPTPDTTKPIPSGAPATGRPSAAPGVPRGQQAAGFAVTVSVLHMGLALRWPEMALERGEAEMVGASLDNLCREFGYKPSSKGAAVLAFAGTALMVYGPKVAAIRAHSAGQAPAKPAQRPAAAPPSAPAAVPTGAPADAPTGEPGPDWDAIALAARTTVAVQG
jgi:hypothetical protein